MVTLTPQGFCDRCARDAHVAWATIISGRNLAVGMGEVPAIYILNSEPDELTTYRGMRSSGRLSCEPTPST
jgi:hypothetical protein